MDMRRFNVLIGVAALALATLMTIQVVQLVKAVKLSQQQFGAQVNKALTGVALQLEKIDQERRVLAVSSDMNVDVRQESMVWITNEEDQVVRQHPSGTITTRSKRVTIQLNAAKPDSPADSMVENIIRFRGSPNMARVLSATFDDLSPTGPPPADWIRPDLVDTLLHHAIVQANLPSTYFFRVLTLPDQQPLMGSRLAAGVVFPEKIHREELFPLRRIPERLMLEVAFPGQNSFALSRVWQQAAASLGLSMVLLFSFFFTVRTALRQKKLSEVKSDFINNMTHELKTPIATISLAADALAYHTEDQPEQVKRYLTVIKEENQRMHHQVARVLEAARFERHEVGWQMAETDMAPLLGRVAEAFRLQVQQRTGVLEMAVDEGALVVQGDADHLTNMVFNLLDNANKYSPEIPHIRLAAVRQGTDLLLSVTDQGIGIAKADHTRIFSPFFRVSTGDRHEVKGFGLGLSYVREVVQAHGGEITVESTPGSGSIFTVRLPLLPQSSPQA